MLATDMLVKRFEHNHSINTRLLDLATKLTPDQWNDPSVTYSRGDIHNILYHIIRVEQGWLYFCEHGKRNPDLPTIEAFPTAESLQTYCEEVHATSYAFVSNLDDAGLNSTVMAKSTDGTEDPLIIWHILTHVLYHSGQHQSEAAELLTRYGQSPGDIDFIYFV